MDIDKMEIHKIAIELISEIERLEDLYKHYKKQYRKYYLLCCSKDRKYMIDMKKKSKESLEDKKERAIQFVIERSLYRRNAIVSIHPKWEEIYEYKNNIQK